MTRLTEDDLKIARAIEDWNTLWLAAEPLIKFAMSELRCGDEDALQEARLAAGAAVRSWDPLKGSFSTHVISCARGTILKWLNSDNRGIGSRRQADEGVACDVISLNDPVATAWHEDDDERTTHLDCLTYDDIDDSTEFEQLMRSGELQNWADQLLRFIDEVDAEFFRAVARAGGTRAFAAAHGLPVMTVQDRKRKIMAALTVHREKAWYNSGTGSGGPNPAHNGRWSIQESVGNPWADWSYKPTDADVAAGALPRDDRFKWSDGARRTWPAIGRRRVKP